MQDRPHQVDDLQLQDYKEEAIKAGGQKHLFILTLLHLVDENHWFINLTVCCKQGYKQEKQKKS